MLSCVGFLYIEKKMVVTKVLSCCLFGAFFSGSFFAVEAFCYGINVNQEVSD